MKYKLHEVDKALLDLPEIHDLLLKDFNEALRAGAEGIVDDMAANHGRPWGFPQDEIKVNAHFWFCEEDHSVPLPW